MRSSAFGSPFSKARCRRRVRAARYCAGARNPIPAPAMPARTRLSGAALKPISKPAGAPASAATSRSPVKYRDAWGLRNPARTSRRFSAGRVLGDAGTNDPIRSNSSRQTRFEEGARSAGLDACMVMRSTARDGPRPSRSATSTVTAPMETKINSESPSSMALHLHRHNLADDEIPDQLQPDGPRQQLVAHRIVYEEHHVRAVDHQHQGRDRRRDDRHDAAGHQPHGADGAHAGAQFKSLADQI